MTETSNDIGLLGLMISALTVVVLVWVCVYVVVFAIEFVMRVI